jgi:hypothetical protein
MMSMKTTSSPCRSAALVVTLASPGFAQTPPMTPDVPARFDTPLAGYDYVKATQRIDHAAGTASVIDLPVVPVR